MTDQQIPPGQGASDQDKKPDALVEALRDLPRLRELQDDRWAGKVFEPPPPLVSRIASVAQGCGGILLLLASLPMILAAMWYGYYVWGPLLMLAGGVLLTAGITGVWRGRLTAVLAALLVLAGLLIVATQWSQFIPAAGALAPLGQFSIAYSPATLMMGVALVIALVLHLVTLAYWKRLKRPHPRGLAIWLTFIVVAIVLAVAMHIAQQDQRQKWMDEKRDLWHAVPGESDLALGLNANVTLGYSFVTLEEGDDDRLKIRQAELDAALESGISVMRVAVSGDLALEAENPRMFNSTDEKDGNNTRTQAEIEARRTARLSRQAEAEQAYLERLNESGIDLYLADSQYSPYLLVWASSDDGQDDRVPWEDFIRVHEQRVRSYAEKFQPAYYEVINEPGAYKQFSAVEPPGATEEERLDAWLAHTEDLIAAVREVSPQTQIGVGIALADDFDLDFYERVLALDGLDFVSFRVFQPAAFERLQDLFADHGHPADSGKRWMISETWYGYCLAPQRSMALDADWLEVAVGFGAEFGAEAVLPTDFGCFIEPGGTLFGTMADANNRTEVYNAWTALTARWNAAGDGS